MCPTYSYLFTVPINVTTGINMLYVFVDIKIDVAHFIDTVRHNLNGGTSLALVSTIQFVAAIQVSTLQGLSHATIGLLDRKKW